MPQLDLASFLPQVFWFILIFFSYYILVLNNILPSLSRILKIRTKKLRQGKEVLATMTGERNNLTTNYDHFLSQSLRESGQFLQKGFNLSNSWISESQLLLFSASNFGNNNAVAQDYLEALANLSASEALLQSFSKKIIASPSIQVEKLSMNIEGSAPSNLSLWEDSSF